MSPAETALAWAVLVLGAAIQGGVGFGMNLLAAPVLALLDPRLVPGPLLVASSLLTILVARRDRGAVDRRTTGLAILGRVPGTAIGAVVVGVLPPRGSTIALGVLILVAVGLLGSGLRLPNRPGVVVGAGVASGIMSTVSTIGGPAMAVALADRAGPAFRATMALIFVAGTLLSITGLAVVGALGRAELVLAAALLPPILVGYACSGRLARHLDAGRTRRAVLTVAALGALAVIGAELAGR